MQRVTRRPSTFALATQSFWLSYIVSTTDPFRYDAYEVKLDWGLVKKGVEGEHAFGVGFDIVPALMSFSSAQVAQAFSRWLPVERCIAFENRADPLTAREFVDRLADTGAAVALRLARGSSGGIWNPGSAAFGHLRWMAERQQPSTMAAIS
ncbi:MAG: hypothetical protein Q7R40_19105 [Phaeospirillum sp.]|nr:hypothetical protein [Phaeospirillum sp.]